MSREASNSEEKSRIYPVGDTIKWSGKIGKVAIFR